MDRAFGATGDRGHVDGTSPQARSGKQQTLAGTSEKTSNAQRRTSNVDFRRSLNLQL